jgi:23S rRNA (pseudouridine1915-N3)-methyltransferase
VRVIIAAVGKPRHPALAAAIEDYEARASRYWPLEVREVREHPARGAGADEVRSREGERLIAGIAPGAHLVACDAGGREMTSQEFSDWLQQQRERGAHDVAFLIGGAYGLDAPLRDRAATRLAFSRWTLPHELARLVLAEQLYRAGTIVRGEPYHK